MKLRDLATHLECRLEGDGDIEVVRVTGLKEAGPGDLTFLANPRYEKLLTTTQATAVIVSDGPADKANIDRLWESYAHPLKVVVEKL